MKEEISPLNKTTPITEIPRQMEIDKPMIITQAMNIRSAVREPVKEKKREEESPRKSTTREPLHRSSSP